MKGVKKRKDTKGQKERKSVRKEEGYTREKRKDSKKDRKSVKKEGYTREKMILKEKKKDRGICINLGEKVKIVDREKRKRERERKREIKRRKDTINKICNLKMIKNTKYIFQVIYCLLLYSYCVYKLNKNNNIYLAI